MMEYKIICALPAISFIAWGTRELSKALGDAVAMLHHAGWKMVTGRVVEARLKEVYYRHRPLSLFFQPKIVYEYTVNGKLYRSDKVFLGDFNCFAMTRPRYNNYAHAEAFVRRYGIDRPVNVFYDLDNPKRAVLDRKVKKYLVWQVFKGAFLLFYGLLVLNFIVNQAG